MGSFNEDNGRQDILLQGESEESSTADATITSTRAKKPRVRPRNQHKMKKLVSWLIQTFPQLDVARTKSKDLEVNGGSGTVSELPVNLTPLVMDVAGGKGELAARLIICNRLRVAMVDPRESDVPLCFTKNVLPKLPIVWKNRFRQRMLEDEKLLDRTFQERFQQFQMYFTETSVEDNAELREVVQEASVLVGMHADSATEAIVDAALLYRKPFCVIPCCVFPNLFATRTVEEVVEGTGELREVPVRSYDQFCRYLLNKHPRFQQSELPIEGRNIAIWWDGKDEVDSCVDNISSDRSSEPKQKPTL